MSTVTDASPMTDDLVAAFQLNGQYVIRIAIGNIATGLQDVELAWKLILDAAEVVLKK